jgi:hypothetical protein
MDKSVLKAVAKVGEKLLNLVPKSYGDISCGGGTLYRVEVINGWFLTESQYSKYFVQDKDSDADLYLYAVGKAARVLIIDNSVVAPMINNRIFVSDMGVYSHDELIGGREHTEKITISFIRHLMKNFSSYENAIKKQVAKERAMIILRNKRRAAAKKARANRPKNTKKLVDQLMALV